jgi:hypothetical protein
MCASTRLAILDASRCSVKDKASTTLSLRGAQQISPLHFVTVRHFGEPAHADHALA